ncbi:MAG: hypothetical protein WDN02_13190 [Methylovirgula sp.]|uniref:hypothetical protein n=1 Tax=Methylovirgula sp. TaxID=1978224 RepID=UPI0030762C60
MKNVSTFSDDASALPPGSGPARTVRSLGGFGRRLLGGAALAALLVTGSVAAQADESNAELAAEIHALKAQLYHLENRVEKQRVQIHAVQVKANTYQANAAAPYEPPVPWDKKFHMNGITITPGGFLAMEGVYRTHDTGGDFSPAFGSFPNSTNIPAHSNEIRGTARQSRFSLLVQGNYDPDTLISGYGEFDFLGAGVTANSTESNSYQPRVRHLYATIDWAGEGLHLLAGQTWSLITMNQKGITPRNEDIPLTIDAQYVAGFAWLRTPQLRLVKNFGDNFWLAASAELPQTGTPCTGGNTGVNTAIPPTAVGATMATCSQVTSGGSGLLNSTNKYSLNHIPDFVLKAAYEGNFDGHAVHVEGFGLYTDLYDYATVGTPATGIVGAHNDTTGWGAGGGFTFGLLPHWVDVQGSAMIGRGIGRYGSSQLQAATFNPNGSLDALPELMFLGGAVVHATPALDIYAYGGEERILSSDFTPGVTGISFGSPTADNSGCGIIGGTCTGNVRDAWEITGGFWDKVYQGSFGSVRVGLQYSYVQDGLFSGSGHTQSALPGGLAAGSSVHYSDNQVYASFRYYPFDPPPAAPPVIAKY